MATHQGIFTVNPRAPLEVQRVPTPTPKADEILLRNEWTASTPFDLHQNDGHLLVTPPQIIGGNLAGTVIKTGPDAKRLRAGDKVFGFALQAHQEFVCVPENVLALLPEGFKMQEAVTLSDNFVTVFHSCATDLGLDLPWPKPEGWLPKTANGETIGKKGILIWGGSSSVGQYALQILHWYGYPNLLSTASKRNHSLLREYGANEVFDYSDPSVADQITAAAGGEGVGFILDCIGSRSKSLAPIAKVAVKGSTVAVLLPVIVRDASEREAPEYDFDVEAAADWKPGVIVKGVRTHFYQDNAFFREHLQPAIMPEMLKMGTVKPNRQKVVEGGTVLERAQKALDMLRRKEPSAERLVWRVAEEKT